MTRFEHRLSDPIQPPASEASSAHQIKLYVIPFRDANSDKLTIITQPDGRLLKGTRTAVRSIEHDAREISLNHQIITSAHARLHLADAVYRNTQGYSVRPAYHVALPDMADFTVDSTPAKHGLPLELHIHENLIKLLEGQTDREIELAYLREFGAYVLSHARHELAI